MIEYQREGNLSVQEFRDILVRSTLGERRPIDEGDRLSKMIEHGNLMITARENGILVGVARSLTDFCFSTYLSDLAVDVKYQNRGIGRELIRQTKKLTPKANLILLSAPNAVSYYPKIGMTQWEHAFILKNIDNLK